MERIEYHERNGELKVNIRIRRGFGEGGGAWFGHTDVVVSDDWSIDEHGPFEPTVRDGRLDGRGSTDMNGPMACLFAALVSVGEQKLQRPVYVSCSSDEEIDHRGAIEITERSQLYQELVGGNAYGTVGEPTVLDVVYAHKGRLSGVRDFARKGSSLEHPRGSQRDLDGIVKYNSLSAESIATSPALESHLGMLCS